MKNFFLYLVLIIVLVTGCKQNGVDPQIFEVKNEVPKVVYENRNTIGTSGKGNLYMLSSKTAEESAQEYIDFYISKVYQECEKNFKKADSIRQAGGSIQSFKGFVGTQIESITDFMSEAQKAKAKDIAINQLYHPPFADPAKDLKLDEQGLFSNMRSAFDGRNSSLSEGLDKGYAWYKREKLDILISQFQGAKYYVWPCLIAN